MTVRAIFEHGVFRPQQAIELPENSEVELEIAPVTRAPSVNRSPAGMAEVYAILGERFDGGDPEVAAKHNEHQP